MTERIASRLEPVSGVGYGEPTLGTRGHEPGDTCHVDVVDASGWGASWIALTVTGGDPVIMLEEPIPATRRALERSGRRMDELGLYPAEIGGTVSVIDNATREIKHKITFEIPGVPAESIQPVGVAITK